MPRGYISPHHHPPIHTPHKLPYSCPVPCLLATAHSHTVLSSKFATAYLVFYVLIFFLFFFFLFLFSLSRSSNDSLDQLFLFEAHHFFLVSLVGELLLRCCVVRFFNPWGGSRSLFPKP